MRNQELEVFDERVWRILGPLEGLQPGDQGFDPLTKTWRDVSKPSVIRKLQLRNVVYRRRRIRKHPHG